MCENSGAPTIRSIFMDAGSNDSVAILQNDMKHIGHSHRELKDEVKENHNEVKDKLSEQDVKLNEILQFMSMQAEKNENAEKERDRIFKASTLLPVAILTSIISTGVSYLMKTAPVPTNPPTQQQAYIMPSRADPKQFATLEVKND